MNRWRAGVLLGLFAALVGSGCGKVARDLSRLTCDQGRCGAGYSCDTVTNLCVTTGDACDAEDRTSDCGDGQARMCEDGAWTSCAPLGSECTPATAICDGNNLIVCDGRGYVKEARGCGVPGCNPLATGARCNDCVPNSRSCENLIFTLCAADGLVASREDCRTGTDCSGAGTCVPASGCGVEAQAPDGRACDEGSGQNGNYCDSRCESGVCVAERTPSCDDGLECTTDGCVPTVGCVWANRPLNDPCAGGDADLCNSRCDGLGACVAIPVDCTAAGACARCALATGACTVPAADEQLCRDAAGPCDRPETCDGFSLACPDDQLYDNQTICGEAEGPCDLEDRCSGASAACPDELAGPTVECHAGAGTCDPAELCTTGTVSCPADQLAADGTTCADCPRGPPCDAAGCQAGLCPDTCDGSAGAVSCADREACATCRPATECEQLGCAGAVQAVVREQHACGDNDAGGGWGAGLPCVSAVCLSEDSANGPNAVGLDCFSSADGNANTTTIRYRFTTSTPTGTLYNLWMRNVADDSWDGGESYSCSVTNVGGALSYTFSFVESDLDNAARHGRGCGDFDTTSRYCWMAVDGDTTAANAYQPLAFDLGEHELNCTFTASGDGTEDAGFDGILFTTDLGLVPFEPGGTSVCGDEDHLFNAGGCPHPTGVNWGPPTAAPEHFACADVADPVSFGPGKRCVNAACWSEPSTRPAGTTTRVGEDCYGANTQIGISYTFTTTGASGTPYAIWMRNAVDDEWDSGEDYSCTLTGVTGSNGAFAFSFLKADLDNFDRHGSGCGDYGGGPDYCWMAADYDADRDNGHQQLPLEPGSHTLTCQITTDNNNEHAGFDGIIVTTTSSFVPHERDGPAVCDNSDRKFSAGTCGYIWGPHLSPIAAVEGRCAVSPVLDGTGCGGGSDVCCDGVCQPTCP